MPCPRLCLPLRLAAIGAIGALAFLGACSKDVTVAYDAANHLDLLVRLPDVVRDEPGILDAANFDAWSHLRLSGWDKTPGTGETPYARTNQPAARLELPAQPSGARELRLRLWAEAEVERPVSVYLNELDVGQVDVTTEANDFTLQTLEELWRPGRNVLEIRAPRSEDGTWSAIAVARIEYGTPRRVTTPRGGPVELAAGTGVVYRLELPSRSALRLTAQADEAGTAHVVLGTYDPADGRVSQEDLPHLRIPIRANDKTPIDLDLPASDTGVLELELRWESPGSGLTVEQLAVTEERPLDRPPVIFISVDTMAARHLSVYGYERATTPNLERFAQDAVVFEHCIANAPWTMPSYLSVMTGLYPRAHHVDLEASTEVVLGDDDYWQIAPNRWTLAEAVRGRAYDTRAMVDSMWLSPMFNLDQGFDEYDMRAAHLDFEDPTGGIVKMSEELARRLADRGDAPLFYFIHVLDAHGPYWPEAPYRDAFADDRGESDSWRHVPARGTHRTNRAIPYWMALTAVEGQAQASQIGDELAVEPLIARYDEALLKTDAYLGRIFDDLRAKGLYDDALILISADHGESFEHDHYDHGELWEDVLHVPLIVKLPGQSAAAGSRVATTVQLVDVVPTVLDLLGLDSSRSYLHGRSLVPLIEGAPVERPVFSEGGFVRQAMVLHEDWKLVEVRPGQESGPATLLTHRRVPDAWLAENFPQLVGVALTDELFAEIAAQPGFAEKIAELRSQLQGPYFELYDLAKDPHETNDLAASEPARVERMKELLRAERAREAEARERAERTFAVEFTDDEKAQLRAIGYLGNE